MIGTIRFVFAYLVLLTHLMEGSRYVSHSGAFAVFGFYLISGFLMTRVLNEHYKFKLFNFFINRVLKLYPLYFFVALLTLICIFLEPVKANNFHHSWRLDINMFDVFANVFIIPFEMHNENLRLIPPAWSLAVEVISYIALYFFISRSLLNTMIALVFSVFYHLISYYIEQPWIFRYEPFLAAFLPFSLGSILYFLNVKKIFKQIKIKIKMVYLVVILWLVNYAAAGWYHGTYNKNFDIFFYTNIVILLILIFNVTDLASGKIDKYLGDLAYPVFLVHWLVGFSIYRLFHFEETRGLLLFIITSIVTFIVANFLSYVYLITIEPIREKNRNIFR
jgi:peptidoglycan/LPS O-acetylase OafA/YrhL